MQNLLNFLYEKVGMGGYVTWFASTGLVLLGLIKVYQGEIESGGIIISIAMGLVGIGRKSEKTNKQIDELKSKIEEKEEERNWK